MSLQHDFLIDPLFANEEIEKLQVDDLEEKMNLLQRWVSKGRIISEQSEKQLQPLFFNDVFENVLGYSTLRSGNEVWDMEFELSTELDATTPDATLGFYSESDRSTKVVIELKGPKINLDTRQKRLNKNYGTPVDQAYSYAPKYDGCEWIIVSNIFEIRLYKHGTSQHYFERFLLEEIATSVNEFKRFYLLLQKKHLLSKNGLSKSLKLSGQSYERKREITNEFYSFYKETRATLWKTLIKYNLEINERVLLEKSQKILNRITFLLFCEGQSLLPQGTLYNYIRDGEQAERVTIWTYLHELFRYVDRGHKLEHINRFNGELFKYDPILDNLHLPDEEFKAIKGFFDYNFRTELSVDILGHIFEQSISDIEELKGQNLPISHRKQDGVYYTPEYITQYIVENSIGKWIDNKKEQLGFNELPDWNKTEDKGWRSRYINIHISKLVEFHNALLNIKVIDPACGSGAFLTKAFDYLYQEHKKVYDEISYLETIRENISVEKEIISIPGSLVDVDREILKNNLYGVDLNKESVEITKLSLWIKTASRNEPLTALDKNILTGNSIISEPRFENHFDWKESFPDVFNQGGFDIIIGNPPYVPIEFIKENERSYIQEEFKDVLKSKWDLSVVFMRKIADLINKDGVISMIVPVTWMTGPNYINFRKSVFTQHLTLEKLVVLPFNVFEDAFVDTCIFVCSKQKDDNPVYLGYKYRPKEKISTVNILDVAMDEIPTSSYHEHETNKIFATKQTYELYDKIKHYLNDKENFVELGCITKSTQGPVESKFQYNESKVKESHYPYLKKGQGYRYLLNVEETNFIDLEQGRSLAKYYLGKPKIFVRRIVNRQDRLICSYFESDLVTKKDLNPFTVIEDNFKSKYIYALMNSKLFSYIYINFSSIALKDDYRQTTLTELRKLPIRKISLSKQEKVISLVHKLENELHEFYKTRTLANSLIKSELLVETLPNKIIDFYDLTLNNFFEEVKKVNSKISLESYELLHSIYLRYRSKLHDMKSKILKLDKDIDIFIYAIYGLEKDEYMEIENYYDQFENYSSLFIKNIEITT